MRIVLDTNVISVAISRRSRLYPIWQALRNGGYELLVTTEILKEYEEIISNDLHPDVALFVLDTLENLPNVHLISRYFYWHLITADPDDNKFSDCAVAGNADYLVSDDKHFKILESIPFPRIEVLSSQDFLELVLSGV
jgi:putative PIN family toxin of toxin-antitoxin system